METQKELNAKDKIEVYLKSLEITQIGFEGRRSIEWTVMGLLWTGIIVCTGFIYDKGLLITTGLVIIITVFLLFFFIWLGYLARANQIDKEFRSYYRGMVDFLLGNAPQPEKPTHVNERLKYPKLNEIWQLAEFAITLVLLVLAGYILNGKYPSEKGKNIEIIEPQLINSTMGAKSLTSNEFLQWLTIGAVGGAAAGLAVWGFQILRDEYLMVRDKKRVFNWLAAVLQNQEDFKWRSTHAISSYTNLPEDRVRFICSKHKKICRSDKENERWGLWGFSRLRDESGLDV